MSPEAPTRKWWSMTLWPSSPQLLPSPSGQTSVAEFMRIHAVLRVEAQRKTTLDLYSTVWSVWASIISTPVAFLLSLSYTTLVTIENGRRVRFPVATAAGRVEDCVLKYAPNGQPRSHL